MENESGEIFEIGDSVLVDSEIEFPNGEWEGSVAGFKGDYIQVRDNDDNVFDLEIWEVSAIEDESDVDLWDDSVDSDMADFE